MELKGVGNWASVQPSEVRTRLEVEKRVGRLGVTKRIVTASDDPSSAGIATRMQARGRSFAQTRENAAAGMELARATSSALEGISTDLERLRELAMGAANGTASDRDRARYDAEFQALKDGIGEQLGAKFAGHELFSGATVAVVVDPDAGHPIDVHLPAKSNVAGPLDGLGLTSQESAQAALEKAAGIDATMAAIAAAEGDLGASVGALGSALQAAAGSVVQLARAESRGTHDPTAMTAADLMEHMVEAMRLHQGLDSEQVADLLSPPF